jgi:hypothetical protein
MEAEKAYAEVSLDEGRRVEGMLRSWRLEREGPEDMVAGVGCRRWELTDDNYRVSACLAAGPVLVHAQTVKRALGVDLPIWAERLLEHGYFPLSITVRGADGQVLVEQQAVERRDEPIKPTDFEVPKGFRLVGGPKVPRRISRQSGAKGR